MISAIQPRGGGAALYQMKMTLKWTKPPLWRRVVVRGDMKLDRLHRVIQLAMVKTAGEFPVFTIF
jgi:hypothetical protein